MPTIKLPSIPLVKSGKVVKVLPKETLTAIERELVASVKTSNVQNCGCIPPFTLIEVNTTTKEVKACPTFKPLLDEAKPDIVYYVVYVDPTNGYPSAVLKNFIGAVAYNVKEGKKDLRFISLRDKIPKECEKIELKDSLYFETTVSKLSSIECDTWILKPGTDKLLQEWDIDLKQVMDRKL